MEQNNFVPYHIMDIRDEATRPGPADSNAFRQFFSEMFRLDQA